MNIPMFDSPGIFVNPSKRLMKKKKNRQNCHKGKRPATGISWKSPAKKLLRIGSLCGANGVSCKSFGHCLEQSPGFALWLLATLKDVSSMSVSLLTPCRCSGLCSCIRFAISRHVLYRKMSAPVKDTLYLLRNLLAS